MTLPSSTGSAGLSPSPAEQPCLALGLAGALSAFAVLAALPLCGAERVMHLVAALA